nr:hypothetical protein Iba_chr05bCG7340 [Ipomoea batatas]
MVRSLTQRPVVGYQIKRVMAQAEAHGRSWRRAPRTRGAGKCENPSVPREPNRAAQVARGFGYSHSSVGSAKASPLANVPPLADSSRTTGLSAQLRCSLDTPQWSDAYGPEFQCRGNRGGVPTARVTMLSAI